MTKVEESLDAALKENCLSYLNFILQNGFVDENLLRAFLYTQHFRLIVATNYGESDSYSFSEGLDYVNQPDWPVVYVHYQPGADQYAGKYAKLKPRLLNHTENINESGKRKEISYSAPKLIDKNKKRKLIHEKESNQSETTSNPKNLVKPGYIVNIPVHVQSDSEEDQSDSDQDRVTLLANNPMHSEEAFSDTKHYFEYDSDNPLFRVKRGKSRKKKVKKLRKHRGYIVKNSIQ